MVHRQIERRYGVLYIESAYACAPEGGEIGAAAQQVAEVPRYRADIGAFAANEAEIDFGQRDACQLECMDVHGFGL